jgi:nucleoid-associated protein YgaU
MEFWIQKDNDSKLQLPVKPSEFTVNVANRNTVVNVLQLGDINLLGKTGLREVSLSSFFPAKDYNFSNNSNRKKPKTYVKTLETWRKSGEPVRVIITGVINMLCSIESFSYGERDATGDIYYTISLKEYKKIKVKNVSKLSKSSTRSTKPAKANAGRTYKVVYGDCLWNIAKRFYGDGSQYMKIFEANKDILSNPNILAVGQILKIL